MSSPFSTFLHKSLEPLEQLRNNTHVPNPFKRHVDSANDTGANSTKHSKMNGDQTAQSVNKQQRESASSSSRRRGSRALNVDDRFNRIEEHGVIGNMRTAAIISVSAEIAWYCYPNFDSPSVFASILDREKGGHWSIMTYIDEHQCETDTEQDDDDRHDRKRKHKSKSCTDRGNDAADSRHQTHSSDNVMDAGAPASGSRDQSNPSSTSRANRYKQAKTDAQFRESIRRYVTHKQLYHSETNVLVSRFLSEDGVGQVVDFMPVGKCSKQAKHRLVRELSVVRGRMSFLVELVPAFNYARDPHEIVIEDYGTRFITHRLTMEVRTNRKHEWELTDDGRGVICVLELSENETETFVWCESQRCPAGHYHTPEESNIFTEGQKQRDKQRHHWNEGRRSSENGDCAIEKEGQAIVKDKNEKCKHDDSDDITENDKDKDTDAEMKAKESIGERMLHGAESLKQSIRAVVKPTSTQKSKTKKKQQCAIGTEAMCGQPSEESDEEDFGISSADRKPKGKCNCAHIARKNERAMKKQELSESKPGIEEKNHAEESIEGNDVDMHDSGNSAIDGLHFSRQHEPALKESNDSDDDYDDADYSVQRVSLDTYNQLKLNTIGYWRDWVAKCTYNGRWREIIHRSALCLKLMTFEPTGAIVAALTTSLPEEIGGERNWDYRFTWIRDSSFVLYAFLKLGYKAEASAFMQWISKRCEESSKQDGSLQIMYGIHGEHELQEKHLDHLAGYRDSQPVRIGNDAYGQVQLDIYGELMDTVYLSNKYAEPISYEFWKHVRKMVEWICNHWHEEDEGIWETRGGRKSFVYSKVLAWVAVDRGIRLAEKRSFPANLVRWHQVRDSIYEEIQAKGWNEQRRAYTQSYGSDVLDASVLIMPLVFFTAPTDPRFVSTLEQILQSVNEGGLVSNNLVFRYNIQMSADGLSGQEGTFSICTFWAVEAAARLGAYRSDFLDKARFMFETMLGYANHLGLYGEEIGKRGEHLGNFPQAFTHLALISAAVNLDRALEHNHAPTLTNAI